MLLENIFLFIFGLLEGLLSFFFNSCIVLFHVKSLRNGLKMSSSDLLQLVMGATNLTMRGSLLGKTIVMCLPIYYQISFFRVMVLLLPFHLNFNYWLVAWLSTHYWISITNLKHEMFVQMKRAFSSLLPPLLLLSALMSLAIALSSIGSLHMWVSDQNATVPVIQSSLTGFNFIIPTATCICLSFSVILISLTITVWSLLRHVWNMKAEGSGLSGTSVQAHVSAVRTLVLLLLLSVVISTADLIIFLPRPDFNGLVYAIAWLLLALFPLLEASIIIQSSPKLRKMIIQMFCAGKLVGNDN